MRNSDPINVITDNVVTVIDNKFDDKNVPQNLLNYLYLVTTGLVLCFDKDYVDYIFKKLLRVSFVEDDYYDLEMYFDTNSVDINYNILYIDEGFNTLEFMVKSMIDIISKSYDLDQYDELLSNVIKSLKVEEVIKAIYSLIDKNKNSKIKEALMIFKDFDINMYHYDGDNAITNLFRPLFKYSFVKNLFDKSLISGDYRETYEEFDDILGENSFADMINEIDDIKKLLNKKQVNTYNVACAYLNVRNNFVQSYISLKFDTI